MYKAAVKDKKKVITILKAALARDPHTNWYVTGSLTRQKENKKYEAFLEYNFFHALIQGDVYLSDNNEGCALWVKYDRKRFSFKMLLTDIKFLLDFGIKHTLEIVKMQKYIDSQHNSKSYLHLLYLVSLRKLLKSLPPNEIISKISSE